MSFWANLPACDLPPQRPGGTRWLRRLAHPVLPTNLLAALAARTPARGSPFGAGEAQDANLCTLLRGVVLGPSVFPLAPALMVLPSARLVPPRRRISN